MPRKANQKRVYIVQLVGATAEDMPEGELLVSATSKGHALRHVIRDQFVVRIASKDDLVRALSKGIKVEDADGADSDDAKDGAT